MKKFTLFLVATLFSALSFAALNPYAYGLSSSHEGTTLTVNYSLNAPATAVSVVIMDGETEVKTIACDGSKTAQGSHTVEISTLDLPTGKSLTWKVEVRGAAHNTTNNHGGYQLYHPSGVDIDNNPESPHFGRILCNEAMQSVVSKTEKYRSAGFGAGIYAFTPAFEPIDNGDKPGFNGGNTFVNTHNLYTTTNSSGNKVYNQTAYVTRRIRISDDGRIFLTSLNPTQDAYLWEVNPDNLNDWKPIFQYSKKNSKYDMEDASGNFVAGPNVGFDVRGTGDNLQLLMLSANINGMQFNQNEFKCSEYDLGTNTSWNKAPSRERKFTKNYAISFTGCQVQYDNEGGVWLSQYRTTSTDDLPALVHINAEGVQDYLEVISNFRNAGFRFNHDFTKVITADGRNKNGTYTGGYARIYNVSKDASGIPVLTLWKVIDLSNVGKDLNDFAWDIADNIYVVGHNSEWIRAYALARTADDVATTPCASKYAFELEEVVANVYTLTTSVVGEGTVDGNAGSYVEGTPATLTATPAAHYDFLNWTYGSETSIANPLTITVNSDLTVTANFQEHTKYTITAHATDNTMGYVTGGGTYYAGETVTLKAVANSTYCFVNWSDGVTDAIRTFTATADVTLTANFAKATPRAWAYDLKMVEEGDKYKFSFTATTAANATLLFLDKEGNELYTAHEVGAVAAGANTISIEKAYFTQVKDVYWSVKMDGEAINSVAEITDQSRNIYDFYNMQGVVVDNDPNSEKFGEIYIEMAKSGTTNGKAQTLGLFLLNQNLDVLNTNPNVGIQPTMPDGYALNGTNYTFQRLNIDPRTGKLAFSYGISGKPAVFAIDRENMTGSVTNLLDGITGLTKTVAHCFDAEGTLYVMDIASSKGTIYKIKDGIKTVFAATTSRFVASNITMAADGRGGLWVAQYRGQIDSYYQLVHFNDAGTADFSVYDDKGTYNATNGTVGVSSTGFTGHSYRGALAYDVERQILAQGRNNAVEVFSVAYDATTGVPSLTKIATTPIATAANIDGIAFDYAGDLYVVNSGNEKFNKYTLPTAENICTVPAPESQAIIKEVRYTVTVNTVGNGTATGAGEYVVGETATLEASPAAHHKFVNWTYGSETSTNNSLELVVEGNITVTANFEPVQYTLITPTNDENKGTVAGAGTYAHGTVATLTATPKEGYKFLYWSDRSTENPRTITMTKNEAISAYFVKEYDEEPTFKIEKMWENTKVPASTGNGFQAVGWDGKIYMQNKAAGKIQVFSNETDAPVDYATSGIGQKIAVDEAGNMIVCNSTFAAATNNKVLIYLKGSTEGKEVSFTLLQDGRCDFFSASGNIYSAEGGYVYFYCQSTTVVNRVKIANGELVSVDVVGNNITAGNSQNHVMVDIFGNLVAHSRSAVINATINVHTNESMPFALIDHKYGTLGGCSFELGGKELWAYHAGATNYSSEWNIYNMTDSKFLSDDDFYAVDKDNSTNNAANWLNVQVVDENTAYIYQFCPKKAVAMWKVSINRTDLQECTVTASANDPTMGTVTGGDTYYEEATATLIATPNAGYRFVNWTKASEEVSTDATYTFTVTEDVELVANFAPLPEITYELNGGVWNTYGWTSKKDMYNAFIADWKAYSGSTRATKTYEEQYGIGKSNGGIPTTIQGTEDILGFMSQEKWAWLGQFLDAIATAQGTKLPSEATVQMRFALGNFFGEDKNKVGDAYVDAIDCSAGQADLQAFAPYWGQTFPMPTQPTEEVVLNDPYKEGYEFDGWYTTSDFSGAAVTTVDENTDGKLYAKWIEAIITVTIDENAVNTTALEDYVGKTVTATVTRNFGANKILTVTLPFDMSASQISTHFGNATVYEFYNVVDAGEELHLQFAHTNSIEAGKPYILQTTTSGYDAEDGFTIKDVTINTERTHVKIGDLTMVPVLDGGGTLNQPTQYYLSNNALYCAGDYEQLLLPGLRAFFTSATSTPIRARVIFDDNEATSIPTVIAPKTKAQKIIKDGRLIIIRGEHQYNAQGQMIE